MGWSREESVSRAGGQWLVVVKVNNEGVNRMIRPLLDLVKAWNKA